MKEEPDNRREAEAKEKGRPPYVANREISPDKDDLNGPSNSGRGAAGRYDGRRFDNRTDRDSDEKSKSRDKR